MACAACGREYAPDGVISAETPSAIPQMCVGCVAEHFCESRADWRKCVPVSVLAGVVIAELERAGEYGYSSTLREAVEEDQVTEDEPATRAALSGALGSLREYAEAFDLADTVEEAVEVTP